MNHIIKTLIHHGTHLANKHPKAAVVGSIAGAAISVATGGLGVIVAGVLIGAVAGAAAGEVIEEIKK
ncbi:hypothetical protein [Solidesulfovibrio fructosivorans]|uniref:hypothetical protein n=1 Tax=Solidesulfovibrio fructosivorans TaxID=878 RepID=UPI00118083D2|nr:hypothetical protein [Solidesulfovibrio fructosivorans]